MKRAHRRWLAELTPAPETHVEGLLALSAGLDVWERHGDTLVVAADAERLEDLERRGVTTVVWLRPVDVLIEEAAETKEER